MSNIINLPPNEESGLYKAPSHEEGGVQVIVDGHYPVEVEGGEIHICRDAMNSKEVLDFNDLTNKEILDEIFKYNSCVFEQGKAESGDFIICKLVVDDKKKRTIKGTVKDIINQLQSEKACRVTEDVKDRYNRQGGGLSSKEEAEIRLNVLKRMQRKKPSKDLANKIRTLSKEIRDGVYNNGGSLNKKTEQVDYTADLIAIHSLSYSNLVFADKLGGISMPSLAIVKITNPITEFGDIVLVAGKTFIDPDKNSSSHIFNRDVYSQTYPRIFSYVDKKALKKLEADLYEKRDSWDKYVKDATNHDFSKLIEDIENGKHISDLVDSCVRNSFVVYLWAKEKGLEINVPIERYKVNYWSFEPEKLAEFTENIKAKYPKLWSSVERGIYDFQDEELSKQIADAFRENYIKEKVENEEDKEFSDVKRQILESYFQDGLFKHKHEYNAFKNLEIAIKDEKRVNSSEWYDLIDKISKENKDSIKDFAYKLLDKVMWGSYFFRTKKEKVETTLDNIYDYMVGKSIKGSEKTLVFGLGNAASLSAKEYESLVAVARDKDHYTVSKEDFETYKKKQRELWDKVTDKVRQYHSSGSDFNINALDDLSKAVGQISAYKNPTEETVSRILSKNQYGKTPSYLYDLILEFAGVLRNAPAQYFEVKIENIVRLESFLGAAVPISLKEEVSPILDKHGIKNVSYYDNNNYETKIINLSEALINVVGKSNQEILFDKGGNLNG